MMRLLRPFAWLCASLAALGSFAWLGSISPHPLRWSDPQAWLASVAFEDALVELARCVGLILAAYVVVVALLALLGELAWLTRAFSLARVLHAVTGAIAVPALRRRIAGASMSAVLSVAGAASIGGRALASAPVVQTTGVSPQRELPDPRNVLPAGVAPSDVVGFGLASADLAMATPAGARVNVRKGDTIWALALAQYGTCTPQIVDAVATASGVTDPALIFVGQTLVFPTLESQQAPPAAASTADVPHHAVVRGDTLWAITKARYGHVDAALIQAVSDYNGIADPNDIPLGVVILLPSEDLLTTAGSPSVDLPATPTDHDVPPAVVVVDNGAEPPIVAAPTAPAPTPASVSAPPSTTRPTDATDEPPESSTVVPVRTTSVGASVDSSGGSDMPLRVGLAGSSTLAAALLGVYCAMRRRQRVVGARGWRMRNRGRSIDTYGQLVAAADLPLTRWAAQELGGLLYEAGALAARPVMVELSQLAGIELLWDAPMPEAPKPWEATPGGGWSWRLLYDPAAEVPSDVLPAALPGLVTVGTRHDAQVLLDLEAFGSVAIAGDERASEDLLRSIVLELGAGDDLSDAFVFTIGLDVDGVEHLERVQHRTEQDVLDHARTVVADVHKVIADAGVDDTFGLLSLTKLPREVTVVAARASACLVVDELLALATPRSGLAVVLLGASEEAGLDVVVDADGSVQLASLGVVLDGVAVSRQASSNIAVLLDQAAATDPTVDDEPDIGIAIDEADVEERFRGEARQAAVAADDMAAVCSGGDVDLAAASALLDGGEPVTNDAGLRPERGLLVHVLGKPAVEGAPGLGRFERMIVVYVAAAGGEADHRPVREAVWGGAAISDKRFWNVVADIRACLGADVCPARTTGVPTVRIIGATTDLDLFEKLVAQTATLSSSDELTLLREALALVTGQPFDEAGYEWAFDSQLAYRAAVVIEAAALRAVELALAADDPAVARSALSQALLAMPGNEVLYRERMRVEAHIGDRAGVRSVYAELRKVLAELGVDNDDKGDPSPATRRLYEQLVGSNGKD
ncbi:MAG: LysM peptidoglycan-binding domain-containing protein [Ilumatobacteraceae bacterium]